VPSCESTIDSAFSSNALAVIKSAVRSILNSLGYDIRRILGRGYLVPASTPPMFVPPGHFYSPIANSDEVDRHLALTDPQRFIDSVPEVSIDRGAMVRKWNTLVPFMNSAPFRETPTDGLRYGYENGFYSWGDASILHGMLRFHRPKKIIEIGCGYSSACTLDTVDRYLDGNCQLTFIEPFPQRLLDLIGDAAKRVRILDHPVQDTPSPRWGYLKSSVRETYCLLTRLTYCARAAMCALNCSKCFRVSQEACWCIFMTCFGHLNILGVG
jgi:hypothetical protein